MVNSEAITIAAMLHEEAGDGSLAILLDRFSQAAGRTLTVCEKVCQCEAETEDRNRAIAYLLRNTGAISGACEPALDLYFQQCSILVTASDLAPMGATLVNVGENSVTGGQAFSVPTVRDMLSVMLSSGMYDYSGNWIFDGGFPAKSGVGGGMVGVVNRQMGIAAYSPRLDAKGNFVHGTAAFRQLSDVTRAPCVRMQQLWFPILACERILTGHRSVGVLERSLCFVCHRSP